MTQSFVTGSEELDRQLEELQLRTVRRLAASGAVDGLAVFADAIRDRAPVGRSGSVRQSIGKRLIASQNSGLIGGKAGVNVAKQVANGRNFLGAPHAHLVALGTGERFTSRGASRGEMPGNDFVLRAWEAAKARAAQAVLDRTYRIGG